MLRFTPGIGPYSDSQEEEWFKRVGEDPDAVQWVIEVDGRPAANRLLLSRVESPQDPHTRAFMENEASKRPLQKAGYRESGSQREEVFRDGRWHDIWMAEVQREDWERDHSRVVRY